MSVDDEAKLRRRRARARRRRASDDDASAHAAGAAGADQAEGGDEGHPSDGSEGVAARTPTPLERQFVQGLAHHRRMAIGATLTILGLGMVGTHTTDIGALVVLGGLLTLMHAIHRYGRLGTAEERARKA